MHSSSQDSTSVPYFITQRKAKVVTRITILKGQALNVFRLHLQCCSLFPLFQPQMLPHSCLWNFVLAVYTSWNIFFQRQSQSQILHPFGSLFQRHLHNNHPTQNSNLSHLHPGSPDPPYTSLLFYLPQNVPLSKMQFNLLIYYVYCLMPVSLLKCRLNGERMFVCFIYWYYNNA